MSPAIQTTLASLSTFDWFLTGLVALSAALAFRRGIIRVLFSFTGIAAGMLLAGWYYLQTAEWLHTWAGSWIASAVAARMIAFVAIFMLVTIVFSLAANLVRRTVKAVGLGILDRLLGAAFGAVRGWLLGVTVVLVLAAFVPHASWLKNSRLVPYFLSGAHAVSFLMPGQLKQQVASGSTALLQQTLVSPRSRRDSFHP